MSIFGRGQINTTFEKTGDLVYLFAKNKIKMNSVLNVGENQVAYVMVNDRITDEFLPGNYTLSVAILPISTRALNLQKKMNNAKSIIKKMVADLYIVNKESVKFDNVNSFKFVVIDKEFGRVETNLNFSCELKVVNPLEFLTCLRKFVAVVEKGQSVSLLKDFAKDAIAGVVQKSNIQIRNFMTKKDETEEAIFEKFVEKMQNLGIEVISFSMNKLNIKKKIADIFENVPTYTEFEEKDNSKADKTESGEIIFERVGLQGEGDRKIEATVINNNKKEEINEFLNIDSFETVENKPKREFRINLGDNSVLTSSGIENVNTSGEQTNITESRDNIFERRREERNVFDRDRSGDVFNRENSRERQNLFERMEAVAQQPVNNSQTYTCKTCGKVLNLEDEFCSKCGTKVEK